MNPQFLNVDLEIVAPFEPKRIISDLGEDIVILYSGPIDEGYFVAMETSIEYPSEEETVIAFQSLLNRLSPEGLSEWEASTKRVFNFGYDCQIPSKEHEIHISPVVVAVLAGLKASIGFTAYYNTAEQLRL
jgi:hypothetical protein